MIDYLKGKKTIGTAALGIAVAVAVNVLGWPVPGTMPDPNWLANQVLPWVGAIFMRRGIGKL